jgi:transposase InsO family protein
VQQREEFIRHWLKNEFSMNELCDHYGISRKSGYKWVERFMYEGFEGLQDRSRAPHHHPNAVDKGTARAIITVKKRFPHWGPRKLLARLLQVHPHRQWPAASTIGEILKREGFVEPRKRRRRTPPATRPFGSCEAPNQVWCADFKGHFMVNGRYCYPLTISDAYSRYLLRCEPLKDCKTQSVKRVFESAFEQYGLPERIRTDNGTPFASRSAGGLSALSVWWVLLGIYPERIDPGKPQQNGRHERMHRTLKHHTAKPPKKSWKAQQLAFEEFQHEYNELRPHEALGQTTPASHYERSRIQYNPLLSDPEYPLEFVLRRGDCYGRINFLRDNFVLGRPFARQSIGLEPLSGGRWDVWFGPIYLGQIVHRRKKPDFILPKRPTRPPTR